jgi:sugar phosphate isomerase/epimerase
MELNMNITRRAFSAITLAAPLAAAAAKPNSKFGGVQIGINAPYSFRGLPSDADSTLKHCIECGISAVELRSQPAEAALGAPVPEGRRPSPEALAALESWRLAANIDRFKEFRKKYEDAGVKIEIVKFDGIENFKEQTVAYAFAMARALGAKAISCEIPVSRTQWLGGLAAEHKMMVAYHGHAAVNNPEAFASPASWERAMSFSKYNGVNLDIGHFIAGNNTSPIPFIKKYADRISHIHLKDRKMNNGPNTVWGQGETPIKEVLQLLKKEKYPFQATIEFEYQVPAGSTVLKEISQCVAYCRDALA